MTWAGEKGWDIMSESGSQSHLNSSITSRYKGLPDEYLEFLNVVEKCVAPDEQTWFICEAEFNNSTETAFQWNEFEMLSLEAAEGFYLAVRDNGLVGSLLTDRNVCGGWIFLLCH